MLYLILRILIFLPIGIISVISLGEIIAMSYPNSKYTKWWRQNILYNEPK